MDADVLRYTEPKLVGPTRRVGWLPSALNNKPFATFKFMYRSPGKHPNFQMTRMLLKRLQTHCALFTSSRTRMNPVPESKKRPSPSNKTPCLSSERLKSKRRLARKSRSKLNQAFSLRATQRPSGSVVSISRMTDSKSSKFGRSASG